MKDRLPLVADLLMEAAHADNRLHGDEKDTVRRLLREILEVQALPMDVAFHIDEFDAEHFDRAVKLILDCPGAVLTSGIGKAGLDWSDLPWMLLFQVPFRCHRCRLKFRDWFWKV